MSFPYDSPEARARYRSFKSTLTRRTRLKRHQAVIDLWSEFRAYYHTRNWPMPDDWRQWERAAEDAYSALMRIRTFAGLL